jgi:hypothetical protein
LVVSGLKVTVAVGCQAVVAVAWGAMAVGEWVEWGDRLMAVLAG